MYENVSDYSISLSKRESEILELLIQGDTQEQIAVKIGVSRKMVSQTVANLRRKTGKKSTVSAVAFLITRSRGKNE